MLRGFRSDPKPGNLIKNENLYKKMNNYLDKKTKNGKDKSIEKYFGADSQENLLENFTTKNRKFITLPKK
jgi:hypothetical protein